MLVRGSLVASSLHVKQTHTPLLYMYVAVLLLAGKWEMMHGRK